MKRLEYIITNKSGDILVRLHTLEQVANYLYVSIATLKKHRDEVMSFYGLELGSKTLYGITV